MKSIFRVIGGLLFFTSVILPTVTQANDVLQERQSYEDRLMGSAWFMWQMGEFGQLENWAAEFRDTSVAERHERAWSEEFYRSFWGPIDAAKMKGISEQWESAKEAWRIKYPHSITRDLAEVALYMQLGSAYRGGHYIHETDPKNLEQAFTYFSKAYELLLRNERRLKDDYAFYLFMLQVESHLNIDQETMVRRVFEGIDRYPYVHLLPVNTAIRLLPKWGGSIRILNGFVEAVVKSRPAEKRPEIYAYIFTGLQLENEYRNQPFLNNDHYKMILKGLRQLRDRNPLLVDTITFFRLACQARDPALYAEFAPIWLAENGSDFLPADMTFESFCDYPWLEKEFLMTPIALPNVGE